MALPVKVGQEKVLYHVRKKYGEQDVLDPRVEAVVGAVGQVGRREVGGRAWQWGLGFGV